MKKSIQKLERNKFILNLPSQGLKLANFYEHIIPDIAEWPIYKISQNRTSFIENLNEFTYERMLSLHDNNLVQLIEKTIYLEKIRSKNNPWKVDPPDEANYWRGLDKEFRKILEKPDNEEEFHTLLKRIINRYSEEITGSFNIKTFKFIRKFLTSFFKRLLNTAAGRNHRRIWGNKHQLRDRIQITGFVDEFRHLFSKGTVVVVPTHFSNLDSIMIGYSMDAVVGVPAFAYGAGLNLYEMELFAYFMNRLGAYKVDRRKKNPIYLECLKSMACYSLQQGVNNIFFPGGTRSRNGSIEERLKLGLLGSVVESQRIFIQKNQNNKIFVIPLILGYNFVLEAKYLVNQFLRSTGKEKYVRSKDQYNSYRKILKFLWSLFSEQSEITLSFGEPIDVLGNKVNEEGESIDKDGNIIDLTDYFKWEGNISINTQRETVYTKMLGDAILDSYYRNNVVLASHLVAFAAFRIIMNQNKELSIFEIVNIPNQEIFIPIATFEKVINQLLTVLRKWEKDGKIQLKEELKKETIEIIKTGISNLGTYHPSRPLIFKEDGITTEDLRLVYFYHNRLENYKLHQFIDLGVNKRNGANSEKESLSNI